MRAAVASIVAGLLCVALMSMLGAVGVVELTVAVAISALVFAGIRYHDRG